MTRFAVTIGQRLVVTNVCQNVRISVFEVHDIPQILVTLFMQATMAIRSSWRQVAIAGAVM